MDGRDVESSARLHEDKPGMQALLRGDVRGALPWREGSPIRAGLRPAACSRKTGGSAPLANTEDSIFVNSMSDLFHDGVPDDYIDAVADVMVKANWHTYQVLTKRSADWRSCFRLGCDWRPQRGTYGGASASRTEHTACRGFLICSRHQPRFDSSPSNRCWKTWGQLDLRGIHWVIVGGESGHGARPMQLRVGGIHPRPMRRCEGAVLLQTMGWTTQEASRKETGRKDVRRVTEATVRSRLPSGRASPMGRRIENRYSGTGLVVPAFAAD